MGHTDGEMGWRGKRLDRTHGADTTSQEHVIRSGKKTEPTKGPASLQNDGGLDERPRQDENEDWHRGSYQPSTGMVGSRNPLKTANHRVGHTHFS